MNRREHIKGLLGFTAAGLSGCAATSPSPTEPIPPQGIAHRIKHLSYSDQGGRPDAVQVMVNRKHVYVGHMFSNGVTILDANDPRNLKAVNYWSLGRATSRARTSCRRRTT